MPRSDALLMEAQPARKVYLVVNFTGGDRLIASVTGPPATIADPHRTTGISGYGQASGRDLCSDAGGDPSSHSRAPPVTPPVR